MYDAAVIGGGPGGSSAALELASLGAKVVVVERSAMPRCKTCGGGIVARAGWDANPWLMPALDLEAEVPADESTMERFSGAARFDFRDPPGPARGRVLLVGDAAGLADPVTSRTSCPGLCIATRGFAGRFSGVSASGSARRWSASSSETRPTAERG